MRILWVTNIKIPLISKLQGSTSTINVGGWLDRISKGVLRNKDNQLIICYPSLTEESCANRKFNIYEFVIRYCKNARGYP